MKILESSKKEIPKQVFPSEFRMDIFSFEHLRGTDFVKINLGVKLLPSSTVLNFL